ncbi:MAG: hypothetical protein U0168_28570 [Nannocystaceae bacterium]
MALEIRDAVAIAAMRCAGAAAAATLAEVGARLRPGVTTAIDAYPRRDRRRFSGLSCRAIVAQRLLELGVGVFITNGP